MGRTKVFVGNLSFKTNDRDLAKEFEAAGKVASASIISRGSRSLGYGFVEMESEEEAKKSVELLNKKLIDGREINVEIARPREEKPPQDPNSSPAPNGGGAGPAGDGARRGGAGRGRRGGFRGGRRFRGGRGGRNEGAGPSADGSAPASNEGAPAGGAPRRGRGAGPRPRNNDADKTPRTPSNDTLFVTNLPFSVDDSGLANIFQGLNIKAAHVVRKHNERSKGFGFVEFFNQGDQLKALSAVDKKNVEGRELVVKVALTEVPSAAAASPAAAPGSPAPAAASSPAPAESK